MRSRRNVVLSLSAMVAVSLVFWGCGGSGGGDLYRTSVARLKALNTGLLSYATDYDDALPPGPGWMDVLAPYVEDENDFHSPLVQPGGGYGYALNSAIPGGYLSQFGDTSQVLSIFDSTDLTRSAVQPPATQPSPPRYGNSNTLAYLDGHVKDEQTVGQKTPYEISVGRMKNLSAAAALYESDYDEYAPLGSNWMDSLTPYVASQSTFRSPVIESRFPGLYGYAINSEFAGCYVPDLPNSYNVVSFFDSTILTRNAASTTATLPNPPRYGTKNTIGYADGSVR